MCCTFHTPCDNDAPAQNTTAASLMAGPRRQEGRKAGTESPCRTEAADEDAEAEPVAEAASHGSHPPISANRWQEEFERRMREGGRALHAPRVRRKTQATWSNMGRAETRARAQKTLSRKESPWATGEWHHSPPKSKPLAEAGARHGSHHQLRHHKNSMLSNQERAGDESAWAGSRKNRTMNNC